MPSFAESAFPNQRRSATWGALPATHDPTRSTTTIFVYDFPMREEDVTDEMIDAWAAEAEAGYDVEELKRRGRGRPGRGAEPMQVVAVRLTADELASLDALAEQKHLSRSEAIREALSSYAA